MIQIKIISTERQQIVDTARLLLSESLIIDVTVINAASMRVGIDGAMETVPSFMLIGRSKANLFSRIEKLLIDKYIKSVPTIYATPIINIDSEHMKELWNIHPSD